MERRHPLLQRLALTGFLALSLPLAALAQGAGGLLQTSQTPRYATNIAPPSRAEDTFLGQDRPGPYALTWRGFQFGPGNPVWIYVDGRQLQGHEYTLDVAKGEVVFAEPLKRTQLARVAYGYYVGLAQRNANPSQAAPLTFSLAALGIGQLKMTALPGSDGSPTPRMVWSLGAERQLMGGGLTSQFFFSPDKLGAGGTDGSTLERSAVKLGYGAGNAQNGLDVSYLRGGRDFAPAVGGAFGFKDPVQNLNIGGRFNPSSGASLSFSSAQSQNLAGKVASDLQTAALRLGGQKNQPLLNYSQTTDSKTDAAGNTTAIQSNKGDFGGKFGALDLAYRTSQVDTLLPNKQRTEIGQDFLGVNLPAQPKRGLSALGFSRTEDEKLEASGARTQTTTDRTDLGGKLGGADLGFKSSRAQTLQPDQKTSLIDQQIYNFTLPNAGKANRPSLGFSRVADGKTDGAGGRTEVVADKTDFAGKFGVAAIQAKINRTGTALPGDLSAVAEQQNVSVNLVAPKQPQLGFTRVGDIKVDPTGLRLGSTADKVELSGTAEAIRYNAQALRTDTGTPDRNRTLSDLMNYSLQYGGDKGRPLLGLFRTEDERVINDGERFGVATDQFNLAQQLGNARLALQLQQADAQGPTGQSAGGDLRTVGIQLPGSGLRPTVAVERTQGDAVDIYANKTGIVADKLDLTSKLGPASVTAKTKQTFTNPVGNPLAAGVARETAFSLNAPGGTKGTGAVVTVSNGANQTGMSVEQNNGLALRVQPTPTLAIGTEQKDQVFLPPGGGAPLRTVTSQSASAEIMPKPGTRLAGTWTTSVDGENKSSITDYAAKIGGDKTALQVEGSLKDRTSTNGGVPGNVDTANARFAVRPFPGFTLTGTYLLNPDDPKQPGKWTPLERREYGLNAKVGRLDLGGSYADNNLLAGTPADVIQKAGGAPEYGEMVLNLGWRFATSTQLTSQFKDTFFSGGATAKGLRTYTLGFTHTVGSAFSLSLNGVLTNNRAITDPNARTDYRVETKVGLKF